MAIGDLFLSRLRGTRKALFGVGKSTLDASGLSAARTHALPDAAGTLAVKVAGLAAGASGDVAGAGLIDAVTTFVPGLDAYEADDPGSNLSLATVAYYNGLVGQSAMTSLAGVVRAARTQVARTVSQTTHEFTVGTVLRYTGTAYAAAKADTAANAEAVGVVGPSPATNSFTLVTHGYVTGLSGLTAGTCYFLSAGTAGALTATEPTTTGNVSKPMLVADSTTSGYVINYRGLLVGGTPAPIVTSQDIEVTDATKGVILRDTSGGRWRVTVDTSGNLVRTSI